MDKENYITIDVDKLRKDLRNECLGAYFCGGYGGALMELFDVDKATPEKLIKMAQQQGLDLKKYKILK